MGKRLSGQNKSILLLGISFLTLGCLLAGTSLAWFCPPRTSASVPEIKGEATGRYFDSTSGDGSSAEEAYVIANEKQLYYFNWLQDLGYFNKDTDGDGKINTVYFKIKDGVSELGMSKYCLPPAGTKTYPFVGNFDGNGCVVNGLTISNSISELTDVPSDASKSDGLLSNAEIVGFFGIVGQYETTISYDTSINAIKDLYFDELTVKSGASNVLAGFIAGYANGQIDDCGIHCGQFAFVNGATGLTSGASISKYTLIGDCTDNLNWEGAPWQDTSGGGTGNDWGSSIDMMTLSKRMNYIMGADSSSKYSSNYYVSSDSYGLYAGARKTGSEEPSWSRKDTTNWYVYDKTYLPLNVNTSTAFSGGEIDGMILNNIAFRTTKYYQDNTSEDSIIAKNNSGYLVGGSSKSSTLGDIRVRFSRLSTSSDGAILGGLRYSVPDGLEEYDGDKITFYSVDTRSGTTSAEINSSNYESTFGYTRFKDVKTGFDKTMKGNSVVHGFKFMKISIGSSNYAAARKATINNVTYSSYQFLKSALNFTVKKSGDITALLGPYYSGSSQTMFDLYKINRDGNNNITSAERIEKVYKSTGSDAATNPYTYNSENAGDLLFDFSKVTGTNAVLEAYKAYYFEIPVNAGDYAICKTEDDLAAFLMYLDIGANAGEEDQGEKTIDATNIDFVYETSETANGLAQISAEGYKPSGVTFSITGSPSDGTKLLYFKRDGSANTGTGVKGVLYYTLSGCAITPAGNGASTNKDPNSKEETSSS